MSMAAGVLAVPALFATQTQAQCGGALQPGDLAAAQIPVISGFGDWTIGRVGAAPQQREIVAESDGLLTLGCNGVPSIRRPVSSPRRS